MAGDVDGSAQLLAPIDSPKRLFCKLVEVGLRNQIPARCFHPRVRISEFALVDGRQLCDTICLAFFIDRQGNRLCVCWWRIIWWQIQRNVIGCFWNRRSCRWSWEGRFWNLSKSCLAIFWCQH